MEKITKLFSSLKEQQHVVTSTELKKAYDNAQILVDRYTKTGQAKALAKLIYLLKCLEKEQQLIQLGYTQYVYKDAIETYIDNNEDETRPVKIIELENYSRVIPEDIVKKVEETKNIFDEFFVVYTDYTGKEDARVEAERRNKDPILFGVFIDINKRVCIERFYYIGDWIDEYCDLTFDKMLTELSKVNITSHEAVMPKTVDELTTLLDDRKLSSFRFSSIGLSDISISTKRPTSIFDKIKAFFTKK